MKKKWKLILGAIILLGSIGFVFTHMTQGLNVVVLKVKAKEFTRSFTEEGVVASIGECRIQSLYPAKIDRLLVKEGDTVEAGQLLVVLDDAELKYSLAELEATYNGLNVELEQARENQAQAERNYQRVVRLYEAEVAAEVELEEAQSRLNQAKTAVAGIEAKQQALLSQMERLRHQ
jgi:multidrug efflux pump subunit AcrA (membrane-fusion protein)